MAVKNFFLKCIGYLCTDSNSSSTVLFLNFVLLYRISEYLLLYEYQQETTMWYKTVMWHLVVLDTLTKVMSKFKIFRRCISWKCCNALMILVKQGLSNPYLEEGFQLFNMCLVFYSFKENDSTVINSIAENIMLFQLIVIVFRENFNNNRLQILVAFLTSILLCFCHGDGNMFMRDMDIRLFETCKFVLEFVIFNIILVFLGFACSILSKILGHFSRLIISLSCLFN